MLPLMEKEDVHGSHKSHDPDQPAHVAGPGPQLPQHQPGETHHTHSRSLEAMISFIRISIRQTVYGLLGAIT